MISRFVLVQEAQSTQSSDTSGSLQVTTTTQNDQSKTAAVQEQVKPKMIDVPGSARALSTALEQKLEGKVFYQDR